MGGWSAPVCASKGAARQRATGLGGSANPGWRWLLHSWLSATVLLLPTTRHPLVRSTQSGAEPEVLAAGPGRVHGVDSRHALMVRCVQ